MEKEKRVYCIWRLAVTVSLVLLLILAGCANPSDVSPAESGALTVAGTSPGSASPDTLGVESANSSTEESIDMPTLISKPIDVTVPGQERTDAHGIVQVWVPAGSFLMGTDEASLEKLNALNPPAFVLGEFPSEQPQHAVTITNGYWIDKNEVTNKSFRAFSNDGGYENRSFWSVEGWAWLEKQKAGQLPSLCLDNLPDNPITFVTWYEAEAYAKWRGGRLPTEAEWEYAARGPESLVYPWGNAFDANLCNVVKSKETKASGSYPGGASWVGAYDMAGNVMEWVSDWLGGYSPDPASDPTGPESGSVKVEKGGWWGSNPFVARSAYRHFEDPPEYSDGHIGFRIVSQ